jgi:23S rRNA pseudouridine2457 synthase
MENGAMDVNKHRYFIINKPANMVSQFVSSHPVPLLGDLAFDFPEGTHAIGRLDKPSEGLLLLTTNSKITRLLFETKLKHKRCYLVLARGVVSDEAIGQLAEGVEIPLRNHKGNFITTACTAIRITAPLEIYPFAIDFREAYAHTWLLLTLTEGKFRQVRKMMFSVKHPCMRLIRVSIEAVSLLGMSPGTVTEVSEDYFFNNLNLSA